MQGVDIVLLKEKLAFDHFGDLLDLRIDFRRPDAHAGLIERRIGIDGHAAVLRPFGEIPMRPDSKRPPN